MSEITYRCPHCGHTIVIECSAGDTVPLSSCPFCEGQLFEAALAPSSTPTDSYDWEPSYSSPHRGAGSVRILAYLGAFAVGLAFIAGVVVYRSGATKVFPAAAVSAAKEKPVSLQPIAARHPAPKKGPPAWIAAADELLAEYDRAAEERDRVVAAERRQLAIDRENHTARALGRMTPWERNRVETSLAVYQRSANKSLLQRYILEDVEAVLPWVLYEDLQKLGSQSKEFQAIRRQLGQRGFGGEQPGANAEERRALRAAMDKAGEFGLGALSSSEWRILLDGGQRGFFVSLLSEAKGIANGR